MSRKAIWFFISIGALTFNMVLALAGVQTHKEMFSQTLDGVFWIGVTLLFHWIINKP